MKPYLILTGASRGIGLAAARSAVSMGLDLIALARTGQDLIRLREEALRIRPDAHVDLLEGDCGLEDTALRLQSLLSDKEQLGIPCRALINNAGSSDIGLLQDLDLETWDRLLRTNLTSVFLMCRTVIPFFLRQESGSILNVSSVWGQYGASCEAAYSASKGGLDALTRALAKELAPSRIRVNAVSPGAIDTEMNRHLTSHERAELEAEIGLGRYGKPEEAAELILDIALHHPYLTGEIIKMDGGWI